MVVWIILCLALCFHLLFCDPLIRCSCSSLMKCLLYSVNKKKLLGIHFSTFAIGSGAPPLLNISAERVQLKNRNKRTNHKLSSDCISRRIMHRAFGICASSSSSPVTSTVQLQKRLQDLKTSSSPQTLNVDCQLTRYADSGGEIAIGNQSHAPCWRQSGRT